MYFHNQIVFLPNKLDPEEFIKNYGLGEFENLLDKAIGVFEMLWSQGLKMIRKNEPESYAYSWNYLRTKVKVKDGRTDLNSKVIREPCSPIRHI